MRISARVRRPKMMLILLGNHILSILLLIIGGGRIAKLVLLCLRLILLGDELFLHALGQIHHNLIAFISSWSNWVCSLILMLYASILLIIFMIAMHLRLRRNYLRR